MSKSTKWFLVILATLFVLSLVIFLVFFAVMSAFTRDDGDLLTATGRAERIAIIELKGSITASEDIVRQFKKARERSDVKGILFRVDSPGGGVAASQEILEEVKKTRESGKPVVVSMGSVAASGGYYVASGANIVVANRGTITGSIGVISLFFRFDPLLEKIGVEATTIKSGRLKDAGSPFRRMTRDEVQYFQDLMDDVHRQFIQVVVDARNLPEETVKRYADGRIFTGEQALALGLIDTLGTMEEALSMAAALAGIDGEPGIVRERKRKSILDMLRGDVQLIDFIGLKDEFINQPILQYRLIYPH